MRVYISLPITGTDENKARRKAERLEEHLRNQGHTPVNPFKIYAGENPTYDDYLTADLRALMDCDGVYFCTDWEKSCGCLVEYGLVKSYKNSGRKNFNVQFEDLDSAEIRDYING